jgi:hypothetical protein
LRNDGESRGRMKEIFIKWNVLFGSLRDDGGEIQELLRVGEFFFMFLKIFLLSSSF